MAKKTTPTMPPQKTLNTQHYSSVEWLAFPLVGFLLLLYAIYK